MAEPTREEQEEKPEEGAAEDAPFRRFERLLSRLIQVPKAEVDKRLRAEEEKRLRRREERLP